MSFSQVQGVFIVEHSLTRSYLNCENEFRDIFLNFPVPKQPAHMRRIETKYWAVHFKRQCRNSSSSCIKHEERARHFQILKYHCFFVFWFRCNLFLTNVTCVWNGLREFSITLYEAILWDVVCKTMLLSMWGGFIPALLFSIKSKFSSGMNVEI
jgi:hypothetical protein